MQSYVLMTARASYRAYGGEGSSICDAEPRWLFDELTSMNGLLHRFVKETTVESGQVSDEQMAWLAEAADTLEPRLEEHERNLKLVERCRFVEARSLLPVIERGRALVVDARARVGEAAAVKAFVEAQRARAEWNEDLEVQRTAARSRCPVRPAVGRGNIYFAHATERGEVRWLFCDEVSVVRADGERFELRTPSGLSRAQLKRVKEQRYFELASKYPAASIHRPPALPQAPALLQSAEASTP